MTHNNRPTLVISVTIYTLFAVFGALGSQNPVLFIIMSGIAVAAIVAAIKCIFDTAVVCKDPARSLANKLGMVAASSLLVFILGLMTRLIVQLLIIILTNPV